MRLSAFQKDRRYAERIDPEITRRRKRPRDRGIGLWFIVAQTDLRRLLAHRGGRDAVVETYLRVPDIIFRSNSAAIGEEIELTFAERTTLGITSLRPFDISWRRCRRFYKAERNRRKRERATLLRRMAGIRPLSESLSRTKPWEAEGISRSTWYTRRKKQLDKYVPPPSKEEDAANGCPTQPAEDQTMTAEPAMKAQKVATRKGRKEENEAFRADQLGQLPPEVLKMVGNGQPDGTSVAESLSELEETVKALEADNTALEAENRKFEEMKAQWRRGGFEAVIAGKAEEIRALLVRVESESREKARNYRQAEYWKAEAIKLGYRRNGNHEDPT